MARKRFQRGSLILRGTRQKVWVGRWLEDERDGAGTVTRRHRSEILGTLDDYPTKRLAERALQDRLAEINSPHFKPKSTATFADFVPRYKSAVLPQLKKATQVSVEAHLNKWLLPRFGHVPLNDITTEQVQGFATLLPVAPKTVRNILTSMKMVWNSARSWGYVTHNPFEYIKRPKWNKAPRPFFTAEQSRQIIVAAEEPYKTMFWLCAETGIRGGEVLGLLVEDIDTKARVLMVRRSAWEGKLQAPKTGNSVRMFPISSALAKHVKTYLQSDAFRRNGPGLIFPTKNGTPHDVHTVVKRVLQPLLDELKIPYRKGTGFHAFRHGNATLMDTLNVPARVRQDRLGHAEFATTFGYTHSLTADHHRVAEALGELFAQLCPSTAASG